VHIPRASGLTSGELHLPQALGRRVDVLQCVAIPCPIQKGEGRATGRRRIAAKSPCSSWAADSAGLATLPGLPITRKVGVGVVVAAIIAGMLVLMGIIFDIEDGLHDLDETSQQ
jgi:hypothetical protein